MPSRRTRAHADGGDEVINTESPGTEPDPPVLSRTRSGRAVRTIVAPTPKTPTRRSRKAAIQEESVQELSSDKCDAEIDQCSPSAADPASAADTQDSPPVLLDSAALTGSDRISEKENVVDNTEVCSTGSTDPEKKAKKRTHSESSERKDKMIPLGKPKSGRVWKDRNKQRFSALLRDKPLRTSWEKKMEAKREKQLVKQYHQQLKDEQTKEKEERKRRRAENLKRRAENERKAEIVQVIKNTAKIKRMKKKQLRKVEKRDTLSMVQKTPPSVKKGPSKESNSL